MTPLDWRRKPVSDVFSSSLTHRLHVARYRTLGDVLAASEEELVARVLWVGPTRAKAIRAKAYEAARRLGGADVPPPAETVTASHNAAIWPPVAFGLLIAVTLACLGVAITLSVL